MEGAFCNSEMLNCGPYGYLAAHQSGEVLGHTYKCPNSDGFESQEIAESYMLESGETFESSCVSSWEELTCPSSMHHVSGSFYTDKSGNLHEGYPC